MSMTLDVLTDDELMEQHHMAAGMPHRNLVTRLHEGLRALYRHRTDRLVVAEIIWYCPDGTRLIPDVAVVFGVPMRDDVGSYRIGVDGPPAAVVFEVVSPFDDERTYNAKMARHWAAGTAELWFLHHQSGLVTRWVRAERAWVEDPDHACALLDGIRIDSMAQECVPRYADGSEFPDSVSAALERAEQERQRAEQERQRAERAEARLRAAGIDPDA